MAHSNTSVRPSGDDAQPPDVKAGTSRRRPEASPRAAAVAQSRRTLGARGEAHACRYLESRGYRIAETNWRCSEGEIDIVAIDGREVVVVEVKTRRTTRFGPAVEAVTHEKHLRLRRLAALWMREHDARGPVRVDVIGIEVDDSGVHVDHRTRVIL